MTYTHTHVCFWFEVYMFSSGLKLNSCLTNLHVLFCFETNRLTCFSSGFSVKKLIMSAAAAVRNVIKREKYM